MRYKEMKGNNSMGQYSTYLFNNKLNELEIPLTEVQISQFVKYYEMLVEWNKVMNLTSIIDFGEVIEKHFIDSLSIVKAYSLTQKNEILDVGTGAGFPGIPIKIAYPNTKMTLLESLNKRVHFLELVIQSLGLNNIRTLAGRAEDHARMEEHREKYDLCVSRAVANLSTLSEYCLPYVKKGGTFIAYKGGEIEDETKSAEKAIEQLGGKMSSLVTFFLPSSDIRRTLVSIKKVNQTPFKYPRRAGLPLKKPLL